MGRQVYCIDSSALIGPFHKDYRHTVFGGLWTKVDELIEQGRLIAPDEVYKELMRQEDELSQWAKERKAMFVPHNQYHTRKVQEIGVKFPRLSQQRYVTNDADPWVIALAIDRKCPVVSHEKSGSVENPKIPFICGHYHLSHWAFLDIVFREGWEFP